MDFHAAHGQPPRNAHGDIIRREYKEHEVSSSHIGSSNQTPTQTAMMKGESGVFFVTRQLDRVVFI